MPDEPTVPVEPATDPTPNPDPAALLGDAGQKAIDAMKEQVKAAKAEARAAKADAAELAKLREQNQTEAEKAISAAEAKGRTEALSTANDRILRAEVKALAGGKFTDPADALRLLDLSDFSVDESGDVDTKAIKKALDALLADKPYLAANSAQGTPAVPIGARSGSATDGDMNARLRQAAGRA